LGKSEYAGIQADLGSLLKLHHDLSSLEAPFTKEEIDDVIRNLPSDKSPGPDGFNTYFIKKCWHIIRSDFYKLLEEFYNGNLLVQSINGSYITLIPKNECPTTVLDFRPISPLNCTIKIITKLYKQTAR
jgi:hypothetical protein